MSIALRPFHFYLEPFERKVSGTQYYVSMRKAIGFVIVLWALSHFLSQTFVALNAAAAQSFKTLETAAKVAEQNLIKK